MYWRLWWLSVLSDRRTASKANAGLRRVSCVVTLITVGHEMLAYEKKIPRVILAN